MNSFSKDEDEAFRVHRDGRCPDDCGFCEDLRLSDWPSHQREYNRIAGLKAKYRNKPQTLVPATKAPPEWTIRARPKPTKSKPKRK
jgi:hypothetical protein